MLLWDAIYIFGAGNSFHQTNNIKTYQYQEADSRMEIDIQTLDLESKTLDENLF